MKIFVNILPLVFDFIHILTFVDILSFFFFFLTVFGRKCTTAGKMIAIRVLAIFAVMTIMNLFAIEDSAFSYLSNLIIVII